MAHIIGDKLGHHCFSFSNLSAWNALPSSLCPYITFDALKSGLKTHLFQEYLRMFLLAFFFLISYIPLMSTCVSIFVGVFCVCVLCKYACITKILLNQLFISRHIAASREMLDKNALLFFYYY